jgi:uncharacterized protein (TIGR02996 family)
MTDHDIAFLRTCLDHPDDDTPRLIYADWLEDHDEQARAELIRVQCELEKLTDEDPRGVVLGEREAELLTAHAHSWRAGLPVWVRRPGRSRQGTLVRNQGRAQFRRGLFHFRLSASEFLRQGKTLRRKVPFDSLCLHKAAGHIHDLLASGLLEGLRHLDIGYNHRMSDDEAIELANSGQLVSLRSLNVANLQFGPDAWQALVSSPHLANLTLFQADACPEILLGVLVQHAAWTGLQRLRLGGCSFAPNLVVAFADSPRWTSLQELNISFGRIGPNGTEAMARSPYLRNLRWLTLRYCSLEDKGIKALVGSPNVGSLVYLNLTDNGIGAEGARAVGTSPHLGNLLRLELDDNRVGDDLLADLASSQLHQLTWLGIAGGGGLTDAGVQALARGPLLGHLSVLNLRVNRSITSTGIKALVENSAAKNLQRLDLSGCTVGPEGARVIARSPHLPSLHTLYLARSGIRREGAEALAVSPGLLALVNLDLRFNEIRDAGARALLASPLAARLNKLYLYTNYITKPVCQQLREQLGKRVFV